MRSVPVEHDSDVLGDVLKGRDRGHLFVRGEPFVLRVRDDEDVECCTVLRDTYDVQCGAA